MKKKQKKQNVASQSARAASIALNRRVFFRGLGWDGDGVGGRERTSPPRLICRGTDELIGDGGTGDVDTKGHFTFPPSHVVL